MHQSSIRVARRPDLAAIETIIDATGLFPSELVADLFNDNSDLQTASEFWLVYDDQGVKGVCYCAPETMANGTWNLLMIAVHPDCQGNGVGQQLMQQVERTLRALQVRVLLVETSGTEDFARTR